MFARRRSECIFQKIYSRQQLPKIVPEPKFNSLSGSSKKARSSSTKVVLGRGASRNWYLA